MIIVVVLLFKMKMKKKNIRFFFLSIGNRSASIEISLPTSGCGIRNDLQIDGSLDMSVRLVIQMDEKLRQKTDFEKLVRCNLPNRMMEMNIGMTEDKKITR